MSLPDWTQGAPRLCYDACAACGAVHAFPRPFCPRCGSDKIGRREASGLGTVASVTQVTRAPSKDLQVQVPYTLVLVDLDEGVRVMGHGEKGLAIGMRVRSEFGGAMTPIFIGAQGALAPPP